MWTLPPFWPFFNENSRTPLQIRVKFKETPPKLVDFHIHSPQIGEYGLHPPPQKKYTSPPLDVFDIFP